MQPYIFHIRQSHFVTFDANSLTQENVIEFANHAYEGAARGVHLVVAVDHEDYGLTIDLQSVQLNCAPDGGWRLRHVSHPTQNIGLTASSRDGSGRRLKLRQCTEHGGKLWNSQRRVPFKAAIGDSFS